MKIIGLIFIGLLIFSIFLAGCKSDEVTGATTLEANETGDDGLEENSAEESSEEEFEEGEGVLRFKGKEGDAFLNNIVN